MDGLVLTAAGSSRRFGGGTSKVLLDLRGRPVIARALEPFLEALPSLAVVVTAREEDRARLEAALAGARVVAGGATRQASVARGLQALPPEVEVVLVHDAARPLLGADLVRRVAAAARAHGAALPALPVGDSLHALTPDGTRLLHTVAREGLVAAQTPQAARRELLARAHAHAAARALEATDEAGLLLAAGIPVAVVPGEARNLKLTRPEDLVVARALLGPDAPGRGAHGP